MTDAIHHIEVDFNDSYRSYSNRMNFKRLRLILLVSICFLSVQMSYPLLYSLTTGRSHHYLMPLVIMNFLFVAAELALLVFTHKVYLNMEKKEQFGPSLPRETLFKISLLVLFSGFLSGAVFAETQYSFLAPFAQICMSLSVLFFLRFRTILTMNFLIFYLNYFLIFFVYPETSVSLFQVISPVGVLFCTTATSGILQNERRISFILQQEVILLERLRRQIFFDKYDLSDREAEITILLTEGYSYKEIAEILVISQFTVKSHAGHIYEKTGANGKVQLLHLFSSNPEN